MNLLGILVAFISPMAHAVSNIFDAYVSTTIFKRITTTVFYVNLTNILGILCLPLFGPIHSLSVHAWFFVVLLATINIGYQFPYFAALNRIDTSVVAALFQLEKVFIPVWAYMIVGEVLHPIQYIGFGVIILFSLLLNINHKSRIRINSGFWLMCLATIMLSFEGTFYKALLDNTDWVSAAFWVAAISFIAQFMMIFIRPIRQDIVKSFGKYRQRFKTFVFMEFFDQLGAFSPIFALSLIPVLVDSGIQSVQPIFVALYGLIMARLFGKRLREDTSREAIIKKLLCFVMIGFGVAMTLIE